MSKNNIKIGSKNKIKDTNIATGNIEVTSPKEKKPFINKFLIPLIVTVLGAVIAAIILLVLHLN